MPHSKALGLVNTSGTLVHHGVDGVVRFMGSVSGFLASRWIYSMCVILFGALWNIGFFLATRSAFTIRCRFLEAARCPCVCLVYAFGALSDSGFDFLMRFTFASWVCLSMPAH